MDLIIKKSRGEGCVLAPPSKSMAHRYLISAMLASGESKIRNISYSSDFLATLNVISNLGCSVIKDKYSVTVFGLGDREYDNRNILDCNESGSTLRFIIPILLTKNMEFTLTGTEKLLSRPLDEYEKMSKEYGFLFKKEDGKIVLKGNLKEGDYLISSKLSSQFATGMIFALSSLKGDSTITFNGEIKSKPYIDMTIQALLEFGKKCEWVSENKIMIYAGRIYESDVYVEGDESNAAFISALSYLGHNVCVNGLNPDTYQGDKVYKEYFEKINDGCPVLDIENCPDLAPILMALSAIKNGCTLVNTSRLKLKESDRGECMKSELSKFGVKCDVLDNSIIVHKCDISAPKEKINPHNDHRICMANSVILTITGGIIEDCECVNKSYPDFFEILKSLGIEIEEY